MHTQNAAPTTITIGSRTVGPGHRCYVIAEAGVNHDGDVAEAHRLVDAAADAGADAVKFQTWKTELLCRPGAPKAEYQKANDGAQDDQFAMLKRLELPYEAHAELQAHARERNIDFLSTPDEIVSARFLHALGVPAIKVGSGELDNLPYLGQLARFGKPLIVSTGMGSLDEVARAVEAIRSHGNPPLVLLHAVSTYPAPPEAMNVRVLVTLAERFGVPVGLSDHYPGPEAVLASVGLGLAVWEKHLTRDTKRNGPDHSSSLDTEQFAMQVRMLRVAEGCLGTGEKIPHACELPTRKVVRKRLLAARDLPAGHRLTEDDLLTLRADAGVAVSEWDRVMGRVILRALAEGEPLTDDAMGG
jgi:sialic acid synthase SpsE